MHGSLLAVSSYVVVPVNFSTHKKTSLGFAKTPRAHKNKLESGQLQSLLLSPQKSKDACRWGSWVVCQGSVL